MSYKNKSTSNFLFNKESLRNFFLFHHKIIVLFRNILGPHHGSFFWYPHNHSQSFSFRLPSRIIHGFILFLSLFFVIITYLSLRNIILASSHYLTTTENLNKKDSVVAYQSLLKSYLATHGQKEKKIEDTIAVLFESPSKTKGVGGSIKDFDQQSLHYDYSQYLSTPVDWDNYFSKLSDREFIAFVDQNLENFDSSYALIDKFEIRLNQQKKISKSIPSSWPVRILNQANFEEKMGLSEESKQEIKESLQKNSQGIYVDEASFAIDSILSLINDDSSSAQSLAIDIDQPMAVVSTSRGIVNQVEEKDGLWRVVIQHEYGFSTYYQNLETVSIKPGDLVNRSSLLGTIGKNLSADHATLKLQYQVKIANKFANPRDFLIFNY